MERYLPTGNEQISIPRLNEVTAAIEDITFLYMACRGLLDLRGGKGRLGSQEIVGHRLAWAVADFIEQGEGFLARAGGRLPEQDGG